MPICEICKKKVKVVYRCKECGAKFCKNCGDPERELCIDCISYEEEMQKGYETDQDIFESED